MKRFVTALLLIIFIFVTGCGNKDNSTVTEKTVLNDNEYRIYCLSKEGTKLTYYIRASETKEQEALINELFAFMSEDSGELDYQCAMEEHVNILSTKIVSERLYVYLDEVYYNIDPIKEVLIKAAMVKTLTQVDGIERITLYVVEERQEQKKNVLVGSFTAEDFIDDTNKGIVGSDSIKLTLYFTDEQGTKLYAERREVYIDEKSSREKLVLEHLIKGPENETLRNVLPEGLSVISVITRDGVCYLNIDDTLLTGSINAIETIPVYAIVNSLTEIKGVDAVQILINGEMGKVYREAIKFDKPLEARADLIADYR
ncbi:MAG: hypothetical protein E7261_08935 [Lachnospiraceae bacterium]|nr:hypothetical protein [Lachnospiraceae bacterium]